MFSKKLKFPNFDFSIKQERNGRKYFSYLRDSMCLGLYFMVYLGLEKFRAGLEKKTPQRQERQTAYRTQKCKTLPTKLRTMYQPRQWVLVFSPTAMTYKPDFFLTTQNLLYLNRKTFESQ